MRRWVISLVGVLAIVACGHGHESSTTPPAAPPPPTIKFTMGAQNASGVSGTGEGGKGSGSFTVTIKLTGMAANSSHISHGHTGSCAKNGGIAYALSQVIADSSGAATVTSTVPAEDPIPSAGWYVNVHHGPDFSAPANGPSISCGDLPPA